MDDLISRQAAIDEIRKCRFVVDAIEKIRVLPPTANVVEVVRCKDCKYGEIDNTDFPNQYFCNHHGCDWNDENHFCGYGELKNKP